MHEIPECLNRRYKALDELVKELNSVSDLDLIDDIAGERSNNPGVKLLCDFWNILKENPGCNLKKVVQQRVGEGANVMFRPQKVSCYMAAHNCLRKDEGMKKPDAGSKLKNACCHSNQEPIPKPTCCASRSVTSSHASNDVLPLSKVLCNLKEAASFDRKCQGMVNDLMVAQKQLQDQVQHLEHREKEGIQLLKQADCMWSCMEDAYKKKILESQERQQELLKQLKEADANASRWRKNKKDLEFQLENNNMCHQEIFEKLNQKQNDIKCMNNDIQDYKKRIENNKKEIEAAKKSLTSKKQASDDKIKKISADITRKEALIREEKSHKEQKEKEGNGYIKEARSDLLNLSRILMQKKIENEDMKLQKEALIEELEIISKTYDTCKDRCKNKKQSIEDEIKIIDKEIANYKAKCIRCHQCTDTVDIRKFCTDCPRCIEERECLYKEDHCSHDHTMDCVCMSVKQKFLDNVFENMYTVLERQIKTGPGKAVAESVLNCLKRSRNGKLDEETRHILQDFILTTVKKNLNLTIVGGAVKTRCELDPETYKQLMLCLKQVKAIRPPKVDKETAAKKPPCRRWGGESECNCPKGPATCICIKKAPPPSEEPGPCPPPDKEDLGEQKVCPYKESASCGPDCAMHAVPSAVGTDVAAWRPDPCKGQTCHFKNMRAAQCVLGPEALNNINSRSYVTAVPYVPNINVLENQMTCKCDSSPTKDCTCKKDGRSHPRERIIEEVMGKYYEVTPIEKVASTKEYSISKPMIIIPETKNTDVYVCVDTSSKSCFGTIPSSDCNNQFCLHTVIRNTRARINKENSCTSKNSHKIMVEKDTNQSVNSFDKRFEANIETSVTPCSENSIDSTTKSNDLAPVIFNHNTTISRVMNSKGFMNSAINQTSLSDTCYVLSQRKVCNLVQELIKDVIVFDYGSKQDNSNEWITVETFVNEILNKSQMKNMDDSDTINETEIQTHLLDTNEIQNGEETKNTSNGFKINNAKQIKADSRTHCNKEICGVLAKNESVQSYKGMTLNRSQTLKDGVTIELHDYSGAHNNTISNQLDPSEKVIVDTQIKEDLIKEQFKPLLYEDSKKIDNNIFQNDHRKRFSKEDIEKKASIITQSPSMDIDKRVIDLIEDITKQDPHSFVMLKKTKSGNLSLNINSVNDNSGENILIKKSPSGNMLIEVDENTIQSLKSNKNKKVLDIKSNNTNNKDTVPTIKTKENVISNISGNKQLCSKIDKYTQNDVRKILLRNTKEDFSACTPKCYKLAKDLLKMYKKGHRNIKVNIRHQNKALSNTQATLIQVLPDNIAIYIKKSSVVNTSREEFPVSIYRTASSIINICFDHDESLSNSIATRTASDGLLIKLKQQLQNAKTRQQNVPQKEEVIKIKLKGLDNAITEPPAVMKETPSGNYDIVLEKEFEKAYTQTIRHQVGEESESFFEITKTSSGIILDFEKNDQIRSESKRALLMKSQSGLLKVIVSDSISSIKDVAYKKKAPACGSMISAKTLSNLLRKLPSSSTFHNVFTRNRKFPKKTKSSSDPHIYERSKISLHRKQSLLEKSSTTLQKTPSGQYAVFLDKKSKISLINNLISYIDKSSKGVIPIKRTESGEITITFNKNMENFGDYGSMKVTSSGNIYVILDEKAIKRISNNVAVNTSSGSKKSSPYISKIADPQNKAIATTCNAEPDDDLCDASKCVCEKSCTQDYFEYSRRSVSPKKSHCGKSKCTNASEKQSIKSNKSPHIVIKPFECRPVTSSNKFEETYYCEVQSICPYHKDRYDSVSNELLEISGLCSKSQVKNLASKAKTHSKKKSVSLKNSRKLASWNSFDYLPPQLPPFLSNVTYKF